MKDDRRWMCAEDPIIQTTPLFAALLALVIGFVACGDDGGHRDRLCGNDVLDPGEECDDGNRVDGDSCSHDCRIEGVVVSSRPTCDPSYCLRA